MLEEKTDNLHEADGNLAIDSNETIQPDTQVLEETTIAEPSGSETSEEIIETLETVSDGDSSHSEQEKQTTTASENQSIAAVDTPIVAEIETIESNDNKIVEQIEENSQTLADGELTTNTTIIDAIVDTNAEESEDETLKERHAIPMLDYDALSLELLVEKLKNLVTNEKVMSVKDHVEEIKKSFLAKYHHLLEEKKEEFLAENQDTNEEFQYHSPLKTKFDQFYSLYRDNKNAHFKSLQTNLKLNLENRLVIVEELKELINPQENIKDTLKQFNDLRERWKNAGPIPKDKYNHVWNNYHFHVENFYDYLHLDREARDLDFKHNLEQKQKIISRVEELVNEADVNKAFRELQDLHKIWKEDIGPVSREHRDEIWNKFSDLTKQMHDKREVLFEKLRGTELENLDRKKRNYCQNRSLSYRKSKFTFPMVGSN